MDIDEDAVIEKFFEMLTGRKLEKPEKQDEEARLRALVNKTVENTVTIDTENDEGWFAAVICADGNQEFLRKSGFIFETEKEALDYADFMREQLRQAVCEETGIPPHAS